MKLKKIVGGILFLQGFGVVLLPQAHAAGLEQYDYPELSVVPRASDRVHTEAQQEPARRLGMFIPLEISGLATLTAGIAGYDPNNSAGGWVGIGVGGGWLVASALLTLYDHPYSSSVDSISTLPKGSVREQLAKERAAEEVIKNAAQAGTRIKWISFATHLGASFFLLSRSNVNPMATGIAGVAALLSLTPMVFPFHWQDVQDEQADYKKRIYAPVASATLFPDFGTRTYVPGLSLSLAF